MSLQLARHLLITTPDVLILIIDFYLTQPPPGALHKSVAPGKIVLAGDSAGGGLCVAALTILRDMGITLPAGAVLISPWVDLTHSFPSIMSNEKTVSVQWFYRAVHTKRF